VWVALLVGCLGFSRSVHAATGTMYLTPATSNLGNGAETVLALRISPGTPINGVQAEIGYDPAKLQLVSVGDEGTAFPEIAEQNSGANPVTLTRTTTGSTVSGDSLIITLRSRNLGY